MAGKRGKTPRVVLLAPPLAATEPGRDGREEV